MTDFSPLGTANPAGFIDAERREVVVQHKGFAIGALQSIDDLRIAFSSKGGDNQRLCLTSGKKRGPVGAGQYACAHSDWTHCFGVATIDAGLTRQNTATYNFLFQLVDSPGNFRF